MRTLCLLTTLVSPLAVLLAGGAQAAEHYEATITRTTFGIPHIQAKDFGGLGFGAAYAEAQDNICLMADAYVSASAQRSRYFGADAEGLVGLWPAKNIDSDVYYRSVPELRQLHTIFAQRSPEFRALIDGWVAGYNRFLRDRKDSLPSRCAGQPWVRSITRDDVLQSINGFSMLSSSASLAPRIVNASPPSAAVSRREGPLPDADMPLTAALGSNGWAFGGDAVVGGRGLVIGNPHFPWNGPNRFYEMHLTIPGKIDVAGAAIINQPYVAIGFNKDVAWTHTVDTAAHMTLFKLTLDPADPTKYLVDGKPEAMTRREVSVENKDGSLIARTVYVSRYGPVLSIPDSPYAWTRQIAYAVADADNGNIRGGDGWIGIGRAHSVREIRAALARYLGAPFINTMAADRNGEALYADISAAPNVSAERFSACGRISDRVAGQLQRFYILDGSRSACNWENAPGTAGQGLLPPAKMVTLYRRDFVQNSNDSYRWTNPAAGVAEMGPMMGVDPGGLPDLRTRQALQEIGGVLKSGKFDLDLAARTMLSNKNFAAQLALTAVLGLCGRPTAPADACAALAKWNGEVQLESKAAMLFNLFWSKASSRPNIWNIPFNPADPVNTPRSLAVEGSAGDALLSDLAAAGETLKKMGIALDAPLSQIQFAQRGEDRIAISGGPNGGVLNNMSGRPVAGGFDVFHGTSYFQAVSFDDKGPVVLAVLSYSQSTDPASPYFADQTRAFSTRTLHRYPFSNAEIAAETVGKPLTLRE